MYMDLGGGFKHFLPRSLEEMLEFDEHIFHMDWFNHQLRLCFFIMFFSVSSQMSQLVCRSWSWIASQRIAEEEKKGGATNSETLGVWTTWWSAEMGVTKLSCWHAWLWNSCRDLRPLQHRPFVQSFVQGIYMIIYLTRCVFSSQSC